MLVAGLMFSVIAAHVQAYRPVFDPGGPRPEIAGRPSEALVVGTPHLSGMPDTFVPEHLAPVLDRLAAWKPAIITIESLSGPQCEYLVRYRARYGDTADTYCWDRAPAEKATGLDVIGATAEIDRILASWPKQPDAAQRRHLAAVFLAAGDQTSALVQWLRLAVAERHAGDGLDAALAARLETIRVKRKEDFLMAAPLAARLGLDRIYTVDDHTADDGVAAEGEAYGEALKRAWSGPATARRLAEDAAFTAKLGTPDATLALYRHYNAPDQPRVVFDSDFGPALRDRSPELYGRQYVAWWETRNLRMVANIRSVMGERPGARTLAIVGASHRGYFEAYLGLMHDVRVADATAVLGK